MPITGFAARHPRVVDFVLALLSAVVSLTLGYEPPPPGLRPFDFLGYAITIAASLLLVARRRAPMVTLVAYCALWAWYVGEGYWAVVNSPGALLLLYTVAASRPVRSVVAAVVVGVGIWAYAGLAGDDVHPWTILAQSVAWPAAIAWFGYGAQQLADRNERLARLTTQLELEQRQRARQAVVEERLRIARELHDVVAHHLAVVSVQAGLAWYVLDSDHPAARMALAAVIDTGGQAQEEMRRLLGLLRAGDAEPGPPVPGPGITDLDDLVERVWTAGLPVTVSVVGTPRPMPPGIGLCAYRVVQEALTNVLKHAGRAATTVALHFDRDRFVVRIVNAAGSRRVDPADGPGGHGLIGMRERATLYGGTLTARATPDGGFEVVLTVPEV
jgi:signal transduction histidine kinase